jgi:hypothetical protein
MPGDPHPRVAPGESATRCGVVVSIDVDFRVAHRVGDGLAAGVALLAEPDFLDHPRLLVDHRLFRALFGLYGAVPERIFTDAGGAICRPSLDLDVLVEQRDLIRVRLLANVGADPDAAVACVALAETKLLLGSRNGLFATRRVTLCSADPITAV